MNDDKRLVRLLDLLDLLYQRLGVFEEELVISSNASTKFELRQRIKREVVPDIRRYEEEYWSLCPLETMSIPEQAAENYLHQVERAVVVVEQNLLPSYSAELVPLLQDLRGKLAVDESASSKLKIALPLIPAIASYEVEMDASKAMSLVWDSLKNWIRK